MPHRDPSGLFLSKDCYERVRDLLAPGCKITWLVAESNYRLCLERQRDPWAGWHGSEGDGWAWSQLTEAHRSAWAELQNRLEALIREAANRIPNPPEADDNGRVFRSSDLLVREIRLESEREIVLFFEPGLSIMGCDICPTVEIENWEIVDAYWTE
jgi:hypothetical protein